MENPFLFAYILVSLLSAPLAPAQTNWLMRPSGTAQNLNTVGYGIGAFLIGGYGVCLTSTNGIAWTGSSMLNTSVTSLAYCNGVWYGVGSFSGGTFGISTNNGRTWTGRTIAGVYAQAIAYGAGTLVALGNSGLIRYSTDLGLTWNIGLSPTSNPLYGVAYGNGTWVAVGTYGTVVTSSDGQLWSLQSPADADISRSVAYGAGTFVMAADDASLGSKLLTSTNGGVNWTTATSPPAHYVSADHVAYGNGIWVAVGLVGRILVSADAGRTWALQNSGITIDLSGVTYGNGMWIAVGNNGTIITSQASGGGEPPLVPSLQIQRAVELDWQSQDAAVYQVQCSTNQSAWQDTGYPILGDGQSKKFYDGAGESSKKFYRIQVK
jgi:hypothetical protein